MIDTIVVTYFAGVVTSTRFLAIHLRDDGNYVVDVNLVMTAFVMAFFWPLILVALLATRCLPKSTRHR